MSASPKGQKSPRGEASPRSPKVRQGSDGSPRALASPTAARSGRSGGPSPRRGASARTLDSSSRSGQETTQGSPRSTRERRRQMAMQYEYMKKQPESGFTRSCPKCKCCLVFCPCLFCCQPNQTLERSTLIKQYGGGSSPRSRGGHHVNHALIHSQMEDDFIRIKKQKAKWKRRWCICCFCGVFFILLGLTLIVVIGAVSGWLLVQEKCPWSPRKYAGAVFAGNRLILVAGRGLSTNYADVWESNDSGSVWGEVLTGEAAPFQARHGHALLRFNDTENVSILYILGGDAGLPDETKEETNITAMGNNTTGTLGSGNVRVEEALIPLNDVWRSMDLGRTWELRTSNAAWLPRKWFGAHIDSAGSIFVMGGLSGKVGLSDVWRSDDGGVSWYPVSLVSGWSGRHSFGLVRLFGGTRSGRFYILGGNDGRVQQDVWRSDDGAQSWTLMRFNHVSEMTFTRRETYASWTARTAPAVTDASGLLLLVGGNANSTGGYSRETWMLDPPPAGSASGSLEQPLQWRLDTAEALWDPRQGHQVVIDDKGVVYLLGGESQNGYLNDIWSKVSNLDLNNLVIRIREQYEEAQRQAAAAQQLASEQSDAIG